jgi:hypothetical protein
MHLDLQNIKHRKYSKKVLVTWLISKLYLDKLLLKSMLILVSSQASGNHRKSQEIVGIREVEQSHKV